MGKVSPEPEADKEHRGEILLPVFSLIKVETKKGTVTFVMQFSLEALRLLLEFKSTVLHEKIKRNLFQVF
jgi:hypothetical protein